MARGVALLAEGVDRNRLWLSLWVPVSAVALLAEGVDRNTTLPVCSNGRERSPSSRRAWIEMPYRRRSVRW